MCESHVTLSESNLSCHVLSEKFYRSFCCLSLIQRLFLIQLEISEEKKFH